MRAIQRIDPHLSAAETARAPILWIKPRGPPPIENSFTSTSSKMYPPSAAYAEGTVPASTIAHGSRSKQTFVRLVFLT